MSPDPLAPVAVDLLRRRDVREALDATDWTEHAVLDVVDYRPATSRGFEDDRPHTELHRHRERAPPAETYETPERICTVYRLTEPLVRYLR